MELHAAALQSNMHRRVVISAPNYGDRTHRARPDGVSPKRTGEELVGMWVYPVMEV